MLHFRVFPERLPVMHATVDNLEPQRLVDALRQLMIHPGIGRHLFARMPARPIFGRRHQLRFLDTLPPNSGLVVPAFHVTHGNRRVAPIGMGSQAHFDEPHQLSIVLRHKNCQRQRPESLSASFGSLPRDVPPPKRPATTRCTCPRPCRSPQFARVSPGCPQENHLFPERLERQRLSRRQTDLRHTQRHRDDVVVAIYADQVHDPLLAELRRGSLINRVRHLHVPV